VDLFLDPIDGRNASRDLFQQLRVAIETGRLAAGDRLPPSREVAEQLGLARSTVTTVYGRLVAEGFVEGRAGAGSFVSPGLAASPDRPVPTALSARADLVAAFPHSPSVDTRPVRFDMRSGIPDPRRFPLVEWRRCVVQAHQAQPGGYSDPAGLPELRRALAHWIGRSRGVDVDADQILVTTGAQQPVDLVARLLVEPGGTVAIEEPGYPAVRQLLASLGARIAPVPVDDEGIVVDAIPPESRLVYVTPSHQSPTGVTMSLERRRALLRFAERHDVAVIEDDYDSEHRHVDRPLEPLHRLDDSGRVVYLCTFSKMLSPSLRLGFAALPVSLVEPALQLRSLQGAHPPTAVQAAMHQFVTDGGLERHLRRNRREYRERHAIVGARLAELVSNGLLTHASLGNAGLHCMVRLPDGVEEAAVKDRARDGGVALGDLGESWAGPRRWEGLVIGYGAVSTAELPEALDIVAAAVSGPPASSGRSIGTRRPGGTGPIPPA